MTGHKNPLSVERYNKKKRDSEIANMSSALLMGCSSKLVCVENKKKSKSHHGQRSRKTF